MKAIKNWDNKTWLSSNKYINSFNNFLLKNFSFTKNSKILDIGCGRGKIIGTISNRLKLTNKPFGIDVEDHLDKNKKIMFKKIDALSFLKKNIILFDVIMIKQTIHFLKLSQISKLINLCKKNLNKNGKIIISTLDPNENEIPTFKLMKRKLEKSLKRDIEILNFIKKSNKHLIKKFIFTVNISKKKYLKMIKNRYISTLLTMSKIEIDNGINELDKNYSSRIKFKDKLLCLILKK
jgi:2-polyprenyl-3-methyl-5-hydroxy-6-metoxy-1,4-benzoquinol methylase